MKKTRNHQPSTGVSERMQQCHDLFWKLLKPEYHGAMMFCRKLMGDRDHGDDLYQDALVAACTRFPDLRETSAFRPWLYRVIINSFKSTVRRPWWKRRAAMTEDIELNLAQQDPVERHTARRWLSRAFQAVTPDEQALVTLHELEGWSISELAELHGKSEGSIKAKLFRARRKMKQALIRFHKRSAFRQAERTVVNGESQCAVARPNTD